MPTLLVLKPCALACMIAAFSLLGCDNNKDSKTSDNTPPRVEVVTLKSQSIPVVSELPGRTSAFRVAEVRPQVSGLILKREFVEGSNVVEGQKLYQIDDAPFRAAYNQFRASLVESQANARMAQATLRRYRALTGSQYISRQELDQAEANSAQTLADVASARAALDSARINLNWSTISSPISGRIGRSYVTEGALVQNGQSNALSTVQQLDPIYVDVTQSSQDFLHLQQEFESGRLRQNNGKAEVTVRMSDGSEFPHKGTLASSDVTVDQTTESITLRAVVPNPDNALLPGMFVRARLDEGTDPNAILIPQQAITRTPRGNAVTMVVGAGNKVESRAITVSQAEGNRWVVTSGAQVGERVIVSGTQRAVPDEVVDPVDISSNTSSVMQGTAN